MDVLTRSYDAARTGMNTQETNLTPQKVGNNLLIRQVSLHINDDPRIEAQPLYVSGVDIGGKRHDVVYVSTMANNIWAFDASNGKPVWQQPVHLGRPIRPNGTEIDLFGINILWGILSTPAIDLATGTIYVVCWTSLGGTVASAVHQLHALNISDGRHVHPPLKIEANAQAQGKPQARLIPSHQKQRSSLLLTNSRGPGGEARKTLFVAFAMTHEEHDPAHGWVIAYDLEEFRQTAAWCTTPNGSGCGIWQAGQGPAADEAGDVYIMTGNYGVEDAHGNTERLAPGDLAESLVKLHYTPPAARGAPGQLAAVAWFTPFEDADRNRNGEDNFQDYDLGSGGPVPLPGLQLVVAAGKDGVLYVLDKDTQRLGRGSNFGVLKRQPIFFTYFPGFGIDASRVQNLDHLFDGKTHHLHGSPAFWRSPTHGPMLFVWGENECLRAWKIDQHGTVTFFAKSAEVASAGMGGKGGMPGGFLAVSSNGSQPNTGIVWALAPISGDANKHVVPGILRAYDATALDPIPNADGTPRLMLLWDSTHIPGNHFSLSKFCPPVVADGKVFVPTYDGRVDIYSLVRPTHAGPTPTNARSTDFS
jgi:outer membrane protein assembly factor BamB